MNRVRKSREGPLVTQASNSYLFLSALRASLSRHVRGLSVIRYEKNNNEIPSLFQALGWKKRKTWKHTRKVCWARKRKKVPPLLSSVYSRFIFAFTLSQFSGPNYLGAWNRLRDPRLNNCEQRYLTDSHWVQGLQFSVCSSFTLAATPYDHNWSIISDLHI